jgi:copper homeostasis protein CutC
MKNFSERLEEAIRRDVERILLKGEELPQLEGYSRVSAAVDYHLERIAIFISGAFVKGTD